MNRKVFTLLAVSGLLVGLGVAPVFAQSNLQVKANIPFEFMVAGKTLPAGEYSVSSKDTSGVLAIRNDDTSDAALVITNSVETLNSSDQTKLVFSRYGNQYFLSQIWRLGSNTGRQVPKSKVEREASQTASIERANVIILAMR